MAVFIIQIIIILLLKDSNKFQKWHNMDYKILKRKLENAGVVFELGLTHDEINSVELRYNFNFPPDLKDFLLCGLPIGKGWINWRKDNDNEIRKRLDWPFEGICYDIKHNDYWQESWGIKPESLDECFKQVAPCKNAGFYTYGCGIMYNPYRIVNIQRDYKDAYISIQEIKELLP